MTNPWLGIPLADYEAHMTLPSVRQAQLLGAVFGEALDRYRPRSVAVLGCAGGNGFEEAETRRVERLVGVDINPDYIARARVRWDGRIASLELIVGDVQGDALSFEPVDLAFAGLVLEYVDVARALVTMRSMLREPGVLVTVSQLPSDVVAEITPSPYESLEALSAVMRLVPPERLASVAESCGLHRLEERTVEAEGGKRFCVQSFRAVPNRAGTPARRDGG